MTTHSLRRGQQRNQQDGTVVLRDPLVRNGLLLTASSGLSALIGFGYWTVVARKYDPASVGSNSAAISMMMLVGAVAQLNLSGAMARFIPTAGRRTRLFVIGAYAVAGTSALIVGLSTVVAVRLLMPQTTFLGGASAQVLFVGATIACTLFALQDGVLTGLRRTAVVPLENVSFSVVKLAAVAVVATAMPVHGIFVSWTAAVVATIPVVGAFIFLWAIPAHVRETPAADDLPPIADIVRYIGCDYIGSVFSIGAVMLLPLLVLGTLGSVTTAFYSVAWAIAAGIHLININLGTSLVVETAAAPQDLARNVRRVLRHGAGLVAPAVLAVVVLAPYILGVFGDTYRAGAGVLRLLAIAAIPALVVSTAISAVRARRRLGVLIAIQGSYFVLTAGISAVLLQLVGVAGAGWGLLISQTVIAGVLVLRRDLWLTDAGTTHRIGHPSLERIRDAAALLVIRTATRWHSRARIDRWINTLRVIKSRREARELLVHASRVHPMPPGAAWNTARRIPTVTDVAVAVLSHGPGAPTGVVKMARSSAARSVLGRQREVLTRLSADVRLGEWRRLLPRIMAFRADSGECVSVETFTPMVDMGTVLSRNPAEWCSVTSDALAAISELHSRTSELIVVDAPVVAEWIDPPLHDLTRVCQELTPESASALDTVRAVVEAASIGRVVQVSWTHGDFHPGNVLLATECGPVTGIVDWGGARPDRLSDLDNYLMLLSTTATVEHLELGAVVAQRIRYGGLLPVERDLLTAARTPAMSSPRGEALPEVPMVLLAWLAHTSDVLRTCRTYRSNRVWWALNVVPVLRVLTECPSLVDGRHRPDGDTSEHFDVRPVGTPTLSVVICAYTEDRWTDLVSAVTSVRVQSCPPEEIVLVIDHNEALRARAEREFPGVTVLPNRNEQGLSGARNTGVGACTGAVVAFLDDDAFTAVDWLATLALPYRDPDVLGVGGLVVARWLDRRPRWFPREFDWVVGCTYHGVPEGRAEVRNMIGANMSFRRAALDEAGGFRTDLGRVGTRPVGCEETELCIRLSTAHPGGVHVYEPAARVWHNVPAARGRWAYFLSRCYCEGLSKSVVSGLAGRRRALASERKYLLATVPRGVLRNLGDGCRGHLWGFAAAVAMLAGVGVTVIGYATGTVHRRFPHWRLAPLEGPRARSRVARLAGFATLVVVLGLWLTSLPDINLLRIGDYGLVPLLPVGFWAALAVLLGSFCMWIRRTPTSTPIIAAHVVVLIAILHATPSVVYGTLRYSWAWKHVGLVDYFQRHNGIDTSLHALSAYQYWPAFFNLLAIGPLFLIFRTFTRDRRLIWTAITIFFLTSWVGQDYFAPQACAYLLYLTIVALVLRHLGPDSSARDRRTISVVAILPLIAALVPTHQLTAPMTACALVVLAVSRTRRTMLLAAAALVLTLCWDLGFAGSWISDNMHGFSSAFGDVGQNAGSGLIDLGVASRSQVVVAAIDRGLSAMVWLFAIVGAVRRLRSRAWRSAGTGRNGRGELALPLLALAPLPLIVSNDYGGEMIFRVYLFGLPFVAFYAAAAFFPSDLAHERARANRRRFPRWNTVALPSALLMLLSGFCFAYYGKEQTAYFSPGEYAAAQFVYGIAPRGALIIGATSGFPWAYKNFEFYDHLWFSTLEPKDRLAIVADPVSAFRDLMSPSGHDHSYLILTNSQGADMDMSGDLPRGALPRIQQALQRSSSFRVIYRNSRATVTTLTQPLPEMLK